MLVGWGAFSVMATTHYVTDSGAGTGDGLSLGNAWSAAHFNLYYSSGGYCWAYWGGVTNNPPMDSNPIYPGDTVRLSGGFLTAINIRGGGTNAGYVTNYSYFTNGATLYTNSDIEPLMTGAVTVILETNQSWSSTNFNLAGVPGSALLFLNDDSDLVVDGLNTNFSHFAQTASGWGMPITNNIICINAGVDTVKRVTIKNMALGPITYRPYGTNLVDDPYNNPSGTGIRMNGQLEHVQIVSNYFNFCVNAVSLVFNGSSSNVVIGYNYFTNFSEAIQIAANASSFPCQLTGLRMIWNVGNGQQAFDETSGDYHNNFIHCYGTPSADYYSVNAASNYLAAGSTTMPAATLGGYTYNSSGICVVSNFPIINSSWWPSNNDYAIASGRAYLTNSHYQSSPGGWVANNYQSFFTATNTYTLYGLANSPVTCALYVPAYGSLLGMDVGWNIHVHGSDNNTSKLIFFGDEFPEFCIGEFCHDNLTVSDTNVNDFSSSQFDMNGNGCLIVHNTLISVQDGQYGDAFQMINGIGNRFYNNLVYQFNSIYATEVIPNSQGQGYLQTISDMNYNNYAINQTNATWRVGGSIPSELWPNLDTNTANGGYYAIAGFAGVPPMETLTTLYKPVMNSNTWAIATITTNSTQTTNLALDYFLRGDLYVGLDGIYRTNVPVTVGAFQGANTNQPPPSGSGPLAFRGYFRLQ